MELRTVSNVIKKVAGDTWTYTCKTMKLSVFLAPKNGGGKNERTGFSVLYFEMAWWLL